MKAGKTVLTTVATIIVACVFVALVILVTVLIASAAKAVWLHVDLKSTSRAVKLTEVCDVYEDKIINCFNRTNQCEGEKRTVFCAALKAGAGANGLLYSGLALNIIGCVVGVVELFFQKKMHEAVDKLILAIADLLVTFCFALSMIAFIVEDAALNVLEGDLDRAHEHEEAFTRGYAFTYIICVFVFTILESSFYPIASKLLARAKKGKDGEKDAESAVGVDQSGTAPNQDSALLSPSGPSCS